MGDSIKLFCRHEVRHLKENVSEFKRLKISGCRIEIGGGLCDLSVMTVGGNGFLKSPSKSVITSGSKKYYWYQTL